MKEHNDKVLHAVEGVSARLSQLETRTRQLENSVEDLKVSFEYNQGKTDGKLRELENLLREVFQLQLSQICDDIIVVPLELGFFDKHHRIWTMDYEPFCKSF